MKIFLDTSAFAKRYVAERGADKVLSLCEQADMLVVSVICLPEFISTLSQLLREKKIDQYDYRNLKAAAMSDLTDVDICQITPPVLTSALALLEANPLRAMDALHLACAINVRTELFISADRRQLNAAKNAGMKVEDVS